MARKLRLRLIPGATTLLVVKTSFLGRANRSENRFVGVESAWFKPVVYTATEHGYYADRILVSTVFCGNCVWSIGETLTPLKFPLKEGGTRKAHEKFRAIYYGHNCTPLKSPLKKGGTRKAHEKFRAIYYGHNCTPLKSPLKKGATRKAHEKF